MPGFSCRDGDVRLVNGPVENAGRVEICFGNRYGTVCGGPFWSHRDAAVVCAQVGFGHQGLTNT